MSEPPGPAGGPDPVGGPVVAAGPVGGPVLAPEPGGGPSAPDDQFFDAIAARTGAVNVLGGVAAVNDSLSRILRTLDKLYLGWAGRSRADAWALLEQLRTAIDALYGTPEQPYAGALVRLSMAAGLAASEGAADSALPGDGGRDDAG